MRIGLARLPDELGLVRVEDALERVLPLVRAHPLDAQVDHERRRQGQQQASQEGLARERHRVPRYVKERSSVTPEAPAPPPTAPQ